MSCTIRYGDDGEKRLCANTLGCSRKGSTLQRNASANRQSTLITRFIPKKCTNHKNYLQNHEFFDYSLNEDD